MKTQTSTIRPRCPLGRSAPGKVLAAVGAVVCAAGLVALPGCGKPERSDEPLRPSAVRSFDVLFATHCVGCHGAAGKLGPAPPLNDKLFLAMTTDEQLAKIVTNGRPGYLMPPFGKSAGGPLVDAQVKVLVEGIRSKWGDAQRRDGLPDWILAKGDGNSGSTTSAGDASAGQATYTAVCMTCHESAASGDMSAPNSPEFLQLISDGTLRRILITGRPDLGMPNYEGMKVYRENGEPLGAKDVTDLLAYLAECRDQQVENRDAVTRTDNQ